MTYGADPCAESRAVANAASSVVSSAREHADSSASNIIFSVATSADPSPKPGAEKKECVPDGTPYHRLWECPATAAVRRKGDPRYQLGGEQALSDDLLYTRCLVSERTVPFQPTPESVHWRAGAHQLLHLEGHAASDGSLKHKHRAGGQCGWSVAGRSGGSEIVIWGSMPCSLPVHKKILRAELWGLFQSLRHCLPPITVHVDCEAVLTMLARGKKWCTAARTRHADVWRRIWQYIDDIGLGAHGAVFAKCAAHLSQARRAELPPFQAHVSELNEVADSWAKHGADMDVPVQWHVQALKDQQAQVKSLAKLMAAVEQATRDGFGGHIDTLSAESSRGTEGLRPPRCKRTPKAKPPEHPHMLRYAHGVLMCDVCPRKATTFKGKARMQREDCRRMYKYDAAVGARGRRGGHRCHLGHLVWRTGAWAWCLRRALHAQSHWAQDCVQGSFRQHTSEGPQRQTAARPTPVQ